MARTKIAWLSVGRQKLGCELRGRHNLDAECHEGQSSNVFIDTGGPGRTDTSFPDRRLKVLLITDSNELLIAEGDESSRVLSLLLSRASCEVGSNNELEDRKRPWRSGEERESTITSLICLDRYQQRAIGEGKRRLP
jgi:hypothetical protein